MLSCFRFLKPFGSEDLAPMSLNLKLPKISGILVSALGTLIPRSSNHPDLFTTKPSHICM